MKNNREFGFYCPSCDTQDFNKPVPINEDEVDDFRGAKCNNCGHDVSDGDLDEFCVAIEEYMDALINNETFH